MLGYSYSQDDGPLMCFNGAKSWQVSCMLLLMCDEIDKIDEIYV